MISKAPAFVYSKHIVPGHHIVWYSAVHQMLISDIRTPEGAFLVLTPAKKEEFSSMKLILGASVKALYNQIKNT